MSSYRIKKSNLSGEIAIPASKSQTLRSILFGALADGTTTIINYLPSKDTEAMIQACTLFGAQITTTTEKIVIEGLNGKIGCAEDVINAGNSGIVLRFCSAIGALGTEPVVITGDYSIRHCRPMRPLLNGLSQLGVEATSMRGDGYAPVIIKGPIKAGKATLNGEDSQPVSALLIASAFADGITELQVENPGEKPWISLTLEWFKRLGIPYENRDHTYYQLLGGSRYKGFHYNVPGDLSSAAFPIAAALVTRSEIMLNNVDLDDMQGDKQLIAVFQAMGANIEIDNVHKKLWVRRGKPLQGIIVDINNFIDAITILAVVACFAESETHIHNAAVAKQKECDRLRCITAELQKMGAEIVETETGLHIKPSILKAADLHSYNDHRMAMSLAVAAMGSDGESTISSVECVSKTYHSFLNDFKALGAQLKESQ